MTESSYLFEQGEAVSVGSHGDHEYVFHSGDPVPDTGLSSLVFETGVGLGEAQVVFFSDQSNNRFAELDYADFSVIQSRSSPVGSDPDGAGGDPTVFWGANSQPDDRDLDRFFEFDPADLSVVRSVQPDYSTESEPSGPSEAGGGADYFIESEYNNYKQSKNGYNERAPSDLSIIRSTGVSSPAFDPNNEIEKANASGGDTTYTYTGGDRIGIEQRDYGDWSVIQRVDAVEGKFQPNGVGGGGSTVYNTDTTSDNVQERDPSDLSVIRSSSSPTGSVSGIGGS